MTEFTGSQKYMLDYLLLELDYVQGTIGIEYGQLLDEKTDNEHTQIRKKVELFLKQNSSLLFISHPPLLKF